LIEPQPKKKPPAVEPAAEWMLDVVRADQLWPQHSLGLAVVSSMPVIGTLVVCRV
jgi:hypothetical protein